MTLQRHNEKRYLELADQQVSKTFCNVKTKRIRKHFAKLKAGAGLSGIFQLFLFSFFCIEHVSEVLLAILFCNLVLYFVAKLYFWSSQSHLF